MTFTRDLGTFDSLQAVWNAYPSGGEPGDYLNVGGRIYYWEGAPTSNWVCYSQQKRSARGAEVFNGDVHVGNNLTVGGILDARVVRGRDAFCGLYATSGALGTYCPNPLIGQWALVIDGRTPASMSLGKVYYCQTDGAWTYAGYESDVAGIINQLKGETAARETADQALQENIDTEATARENADQQEAQTRQESDDTLQGHIEAEAQARQDGDAALLGDVEPGDPESIAEETVARKEADGTLQGHIEAEAQARQDADATLQEHINENDYAVMTDAEMDAVLGTTSVENRKFNWDFNIFKRFYNSYVVKWLNGAMSWSAAQKKQARANLGFGNGDIDEKPVAGSHNPVESGGVAKEIALGAVYDVTAHNNNATFASLSQLLNCPWLDDLIPATVRNGGMSIRFLRRRRGCSDEYVQFRLLTRSFSTDIKDWLFDECALRDGEITTKKIHDGAVTEEKLANGSVSGEKLQERSVTPSKIGKGSVHGEHIANDAVTFNKLDEEVRNLILSAGSHGIAVANEFGDNNLISVSQKALTDAFVKVWQKLEDMTGEMLQGISMTVNPDYFIGEDGADIHITANTVETTGIFEQIRFLINGAEVYSAENVDTLEYDTHIDETSVIKCEAKIMGIWYSREKVITHYNSFWLGAGTSYTDIMDVEHCIPITNGMRGAYDVNVDNGDNLFIVVGGSLAQGFLRADMNSIEIPFTESTVEIEGETYKVYTSANTYNAGTYNIDING